MLCLAGWINRNQQNVIEYLQEEVRVLKEELGKRPRSNDDQRLIARKYDSTGKRSRGRPPTVAVVRELILRMAAENRTWGYTRIQGALQNLGHEIGRGTIAKVLQEAGVVSENSRHSAKHP